MSLVDWSLSTVIALNVVAVTFLSNTFKRFDGIGKSGEKIDQNKISVKFGDFLLAENGAPIENVDQKKIREYMKWDSILIEINLNQGTDTFECYTCDFTHDYIDINADYKNST